MMRNTLKITLPIIKCAACAISVMILTAQSAAFANTYNHQDRAEIRSPREAATAMQRPNQLQCLPASGAQILGGFASPHDWLDPATGEICNR